jgi:hypothetical protein
MWPLRSDKLEEEKPNQDEHDEVFKPFASVPFGWEQSTSKQGPQPQKEH